MLDHPEPGTQYKVAMAPTTSDNIDEFVEIKIDHLVYLYCRADGWVYRDVSSDSLEVDPLSLILSQDTSVEECEENIDSNKYPPLREDVVQQEPDQPVPLQLGFESNGDVHLLAVEDVVQQEPDQPVPLQLGFESNGDVHLLAVEDDVAEQDPGEDTGEEEDENLAGTLKVSLHLQGWQKEIRTYESGRVVVYLHPPDKTKYLRSYPELQYWLSQQAEKNLSIDYDWTFINFDRLDGKRSRKMEKTEANFHGFLEGLNKPNPTQTQVTLLALPLL